MEDDQLNFSDSYDWTGYRTPANGGRLAMRGALGGAVAPQQSPLADQDAGDFLNQAYGFPQQAPQQPPAQPIDKVLSQAYGIEPFTPADDLQLQKQQQGLSELREMQANDELLPGQYEDMERQIMPRLASLSQAKQKSMQMGRAEQANISLEESARAAAMKNLDEKYHANNFMDKVGKIVDPLTGLVAAFYPHRNGGYEQIDWSKNPQAAHKEMTTTEMEAPSQGGGEEAAAPAQPKLQSASDYQTPDGRIDVKRLAADGGLKLPQYRAGGGDQEGVALQFPDGTQLPLSRQDYYDLWHTGDKPQAPATATTNLGRGAAPAQQRYSEGQAPWSPAGNFQMTESQRRVHEVAAKGGGQVPPDIYEQALADTEAQKKGLPHSFELTKAQRDTRMAQAIDMLRGMPEGQAKNAAIMSMAHSWVSNDQTMLRHELDKYRSTQEAQRKEGQRGEVIETKEQLKERMQDHRDFQKEIQDHYKPIMDERHHMVARLDKVEGGKDSKEGQKILDDYQWYHMGSTEAMKEARNRAIKAREELGLPIPGPLNAGGKQSQGDQDSSGGAEGGSQAPKQSADEQRKAFADLMSKLSGTAPAKTVKPAPAPPPRSTNAGPAPGDNSYMNVNPF